MVYKDSIGFLIFFQVIMRLGSKSSDWFAAHDK
jgi:hypothetical protein